GGGLTARPSQDRTGSTFTATGGSMDARDLGIVRALGWERTADGVALACVTTGLAAGRVTLHAVAPRVVRVRITPGPLPAPKAHSYVVAHPAPGRWDVEAADGRVTLRTEHLAVEAVLDPWSLAFRAADGRLLTHEVPDDTNFAAHRLGPPPGFRAEGWPTTRPAGSPRWWRRCCSIPRTTSTAGASASRVSTRSVGPSAPGTGTPTGPARSWRTRRSPSWSAAGATACSWTSRPRSRSTSAAARTAPTRSRPP